MKTEGEGQSSYPSIQHSVPEYLHPFFSEDCATTMRMRVFLFTSS